MVGHYAHLGLTFGLVLSLALLVVNVECIHSSSLFWAVALAPILFFLPGGLLVLLSGLLSRTKDRPLREVEEERDLRPGENDPLGGYRSSAVERRVEVDTELMQVRDSEEGGALRFAVGRMLLYSFLGMVLGYLVLLVFYFVAMR